MPCTITLAVDLPEEFDSETERRDYLRHQAVLNCVLAMDRVIDRLSATKTAQERAYIEVEVATRLLERFTNAARLDLWREEIAEARM